MKDTEELQQLLLDDDDDYISDCSFLSLQHAV